MSNLDTLLEMGFDRQRAELALKHSNNALQPAMDWLEKNQDKTLEDIQAAAVEDPSAADDDANTTGVVASFTCNECGKRMRTTDEASFHANKSGHTDFSESTEEIAPLTEDQKKDKLAELMKRRDERKAAASVQEKEEQKRNDQIKRKAVKDQAEIKEDMEKKQKLKDAENKRREKVEEAEAKKRIQMKIAADKEERRRKAEEEKARREGQPVVQRPAAEEKATPAQAPVTSKPTSAYTETRIRLQTASGPVMRSFPVETTLFEVAHAAKEEKGLDVSTFQQNMPRKTWDTSDFGLTLKEAGLVPSASLIVR